MRIFKKILAGLIVLTIIGLTAWGMYEIMGDAFIALMQGIFIVFVIVVAIFIGLVIWNLIVYLLDYIINQ